MSGKQIHPDYDKAPQERRFTGPLKTLMRVLQYEVAQSPQRRSWKVLPGGAYIRLSRENGLYTLRIARREKPRTSSGPALFQREVDTFVKQLGITGWTREIEADAPGISVILKETVPTQHHRDLLRQAMQP